MIRNEPTETQSRAIAQRAAFHASIAARAAELARVQPAAAVVPPPAPMPTRAPAAVQDFRFPPMKEPWFKIEAVALAKTITVRDIQTACCDRLDGMTLAEFLSDRREKRLVITRQVAMYLAKLLTGKSLLSIGRCFGRKDHTTVMYAIEKVTAKISGDPYTHDQDVAELVQSLRAELEG